MGKGGHGKGKGSGGKDGYSSRNDWRDYDEGASDKGKATGGAKSGKSKSVGKRGEGKGMPDWSGGGGKADHPQASTVAFQTEHGGGICWNPADRDETIVFLGRPFVRVRRDMSHAKWSGCRATKAIASGRGAFAIRNDTGGNMRVGWSLADATLELGMDEMSFGYGGTAMKSHQGKYSKFGQTYGQNDVVVALIDLERHAISYMKNGHAIPGDAFVIPRQLWGRPFFPHVLTKEATVTSYFGGPETIFPAPVLPSGFSWLADLQLVASERQCDHSSVKVDNADAVVEVDTSKLEQAAHRDQFEEWKIKVNAYANHFQPLLAWEYRAEKESVGHRVKRGARQLEATGFACVGLAAELGEARVTLSRPRGIPRLSEISVGRTVLITEENTGVSIDDPSVTISGEVEKITDRLIVVSTTYDRLPPGEQYRLDLGPNMSTYERIDRVLDLLQRCEKPSKKVKNRMGLVSPCTALADALFADVAEASGAALRWDPSTRPPPHAASDISRAARAAHLAVPPRPPGEAAPEARRLNEPQQRAVDMALTERRCLSLVQGPPGTGKTTTAIEIMCSWLRANRGQILATAFSNKGVNNLAEGLYNRGVNVLRVGACDAELPYSMESHLEYYAREGGKGSGKGAQGDAIRRADVICATVIGSGMGLLRSTDFPFVIVDEAAQIIEPAVLIPLAKGSVQVVMVGDQCQLPATVLSHEAQRAGLDVSLFDRLISMGMDVHLLSIQYRMHPLIAEFPSWRFYNHKLETGVRPGDRPVLPLQGLELGTIALIHVGAAETSQGMSKANHGEAECVELLLRALKPKCAMGDVGVITPYSAQVACIRQAIRRLGRESDQVQVSSVDAFQGSEKEAIILSMVRSNLRGDIGFVADWRRLNVAATRAKRLLVLVGNLVTLSQHALWRDFLGFHADLRVFEWSGRGGFGKLSAEPAKLLSAAREIAKRRGVKPLPLRGDYPADGDFADAERGKLTWDAPPPAPEGGGELSWGTEAAATEASDAWGSAPEADVSADWAAGWGPDASQGEAQQLVVGRDGAGLDLETTRWGMRVESVERGSPNNFEVGWTIIAVGGATLEQPDNSEASLDRVEELFGTHFRGKSGSGTEVQIVPQDERLLGWAQVPKDVEQVCEELDLLMEFCPKGLLLYGPSRALDLITT